MKRWPAIVSVLFALVVGTPASIGKDKEREPWDLSKAQMVMPVRICMDGCLRGDEGQAISHMHFTFTCDLCGTAVDVLIFRGYDDKGTAWTYSATFSNNRATSNARRKRGIDPLMSDFSIRECLRGQHSGMFPDISEGGKVHGQ